VASRVKHEGNGDETRGPLPSPSKVSYRLYILRTLENPPKKGRTSSSPRRLPSRLPRPIAISPRQTAVYKSSTDMYNNDVGKESAQKIMKQTGALKTATLYSAS
jgi:hypothetical protein